MIGDVAGTLHSFITSWETKFPRQVCGENLGIFKAVLFFRQPERPVSAPWKHKAVGCYF